MLLTAKTPHIARFRIHDCTGALVSFTHGYNTDTNEISIYLPATRPVEGQPHPEQTLVHQPAKVNENGQVEEAYPVLVTFALQGSYATFDGKLVDKDFALPVVEEVKQTPEITLDVSPEAQMEIIEEKSCAVEEPKCDQAPECDCEEKVA